MKKLPQLSLLPEFERSGVSCYNLSDSSLINSYYVISEESTRKLLDTPEVVGYEVYSCLVNSTSEMLYYLKENGKITNANILSILRGALNYPLEECCYKEHIRVHDISFMSCERTFDVDGNVNGLDVKYRKLATVDNSTLLIGDIIASGDTLVYCMKYVVDYYRKHDCKLRNIVIFTIGGTKAFEVLEKMTNDIRKFWPEFEGFITVFYEGVFSCYDDNGYSGINRPMIDFIWRDGIISPEFRRETLSRRDPIFEKCIIYDGGARRYEIKEHIDEVLEFWEGILERSELLNKDTLLEEKLGHKIPISFEQWVEINHYKMIPAKTSEWLYKQEIGFIESVKDISLKEIAETRIAEFTEALSKYMIK